MTPDDIEEFCEVLDRYGGRPEDWPPPARARAEALLAASPRARAQLSAMRRVEAALAAAQPADAKGADTLAFHAMRAIQDNPRRRMTRRLSWALAGSLALIAGVYVGAVPQTSENPADIVTAALDQPGGHDVW